MRRRRERRRARRDRSSRPQVDRLAAAAAAPAPSPAKKRRPLVARHLDKKTGIYYYYNRKTKETSWEAPAGWGAGKEN